MDTTAPYTVEANGITLACRSWGPADAPPGVLLHCRGADGADWTHIAERLAALPRPRRVRAPDLHGHGHSDRPGYHRAETMTEDVCAPVPLDPPRPPARRPPGELPFDRAMVRATDEQRNAPDPVWWHHMDRITMPTLVS